MNAKYNFCFYIAAFLLLLGKSSVATAITTDELAGICESMESAIVDISVEYEWYNVSPLTLEERLKYIAGKGLLLPVDIPKYKLSAARSPAALDPNDPNFLLFDRFLFENSTTLMNQHSNTWHSLTKKSYNGKITKHLQIGGWPRKVRNGIISKSKPHIYPTPIQFFSVLRFRMSNVTGKMPLSAVILKHKELIRLDNTVKKVNGFNTIRADFLQESLKYVCIRVYFSVDHGYTPVRYEYMRGGEGESEIVAGTSDVHSLEQVAKGLWFPSTGTLSSPDDKEINVYQAISKIVINQGLTNKHFDIEFPPGTKVRDETKDLEYVVKPK